MKFGVEIPTDVNRAMSLERNNGNTLWMDAIKKEYENVKIAFKKLDDDKQVPPGFTEITCHLVFEVKFDLRRKAMKAATKPNGEEYYAYIMVYLDDLLCIGLNPQQYMDRVSELFKLKAGSVGPPKVYLGANCQQNPSRTPDVNCWGMSAEQYVRDAVKTVKTKLKKTIRP